MHTVLYLKTYLNICPLTLTVLTYSMAKVLRQLITMECLQIITIQVLSVFCCFLLGSLWLNQIKPFRILQGRHKNLFHLFKCVKMQR